MHGDWSGVGGDGGSVKGRNYSCINLLGVTR